MAQAAFVLIILSVCALAVLTAVLDRRDESRAPRERTGSARATGIADALLEPDRTLARQRWEWDADDDLPFPGRRMRVRAAREKLRS